MEKLCVLCPLVADITPALWYSPTRFSKKFVLPSREMFSMKSKGFSTWKICEETKTRRYQCQVLIDKNCSKNCPHLVTIEFTEQSISNEFNVLLHEATVHANKRAGQCFCQEINFDVDCLFDYAFNTLLRRLVFQMPEHQTRKVTMQALKQEDKHCRNRSELVIANWQMKCF